MSRWVVRGVLLAALGALVVWGWRTLFPSPEQVIHRRLTELARSACIVPNEGELARLINSQKLGSFFAGDAEVTVDIPGQSFRTFNGRDELVRAAMGARSLVSSVTVEFLDVNVVVGADKRSAIARLTVKANLPRERFPAVQELKISLSKTGGDWLIARVETVKTLR